ncbi:hypothetical protein BASA60_007975 [Batrachochytrium salamandrivorans]|nr:hypothetical protein BASA60_007975 [Batrachochytrium salamandrivorans]
MSSKRSRTTMSYKLEIPPSSDENSDDEVTRCLCGDTAPKGVMVQCDQCSVWQHCDCMNLAGKKLPKKYFCEQCRPESHSDILAASTAHVLPSSAGPTCSFVSTSCTSTLSLQDTPQQPESFVLGMDSKATLTNLTARTMSQEQEQVLEGRLSPMDSSLANVKSDSVATYCASNSQTPRLTPRKKPRLSTSSTAATQLIPPAKKRNTLNSRVADQWNAELLLMRNGNGRAKERDGADTEDASGEDPDAIHDEPNVGEDIPQMEWATMSASQNSKAASSLLKTTLDSPLWACDKNHTIKPSLDQDSVSTTDGSNSHIYGMDAEAGSIELYTKRKKQKALSALANPSISGDVSSANLGKLKKEQKSNTKRTYNTKRTSRAPPSLMDSGSSASCENISISKPSSAADITEPNLNYGDPQKTSAVLGGDDPAVDTAHPTASQPVSRKKGSLSKKPKNSARRQGSSQIGSTDDRDNVPIITSLDRASESNGLAASLSSLSETNNHGGNYADTRSSSQPMTADDESLSLDSQQPVHTVSKKKHIGRGRSGKSRNKGSKGHGELHMGEDDAYVDISSSTGSLPKQTGFTGDTWISQPASLASANAIEPPMTEIAHNTSEENCKQHLTAFVPIPKRDRLPSFQAPPSPPVQPHYIGHHSQSEDIHKRVCQLYESAQRMRCSFETDTYATPPNAVSSTEPELTLWSSAGSTNLFSCMRLGLKHKNNLDSLEKNSTHPIFEPTNMPIFENTESDAPTEVVQSTAAITSPIHMPDPTNDNICHTEVVSRQHIDEKSSALRNLISTLSTPMYECSRDGGCTRKRIGTV